MTADEQDGSIFTMTWDWVDGVCVVWNWQGAKVVSARIWSVGREEHRMALFALCLHGLDPGSQEALAR